jgi:protein-L-isoaspartate(D-aspartate) O-methyltransferase
MMEHSSEQARFNMIQQQVRPWDVMDERVLGTMMEIPREPFVPDAYRGLAYADIEVPLGSDQLMMAPRVVARMLQALDVRPEDRVLEIGTGSGYATACLAALGRKVVSMELNAGLLAEARENLQQQGVRNVELREGDGLAGSVEGGPFDVIAVTGSLPSEEPLEDLEAQLNDGGRLFVVVGEDPVMEALLITRTGDLELRRETMFETSLPALDKVPEPERFSF